MACNDGSYGWGKRVTVRTRRKPCLFNFSNFLLNQMQGSQLHNAGAPGQARFRPRPRAFIAFYFPELTVRFSKQIPFQYTLD